MAKCTFLNGLVLFTADALESRKKIIMRSTAGRNDQALGRQQRSECDW